MISARIDLAMRLMVAVYGQAPDQLSRIMRENPSGDLICALISALHDAAVKLHGSPEAALDAFRLTVLAAEIDRATASAGEVDR